MLTKKLPIHLVTGIVVYRAHKYVNPFFDWYCLHQDYTNLLLPIKLLSIGVCCMFDCYSTCQEHRSLIYLFVQIDRIIESCQEAFILRLYRENNKVQSNKYNVMYMFMPINCLWQ